MKHRLCVIAMWGIVMVLAMTGVLGIVSCSRVTGDRRESAGSYAGDNTGSGDVSTGKNEVVPADSSDAAVYQYQEKEVSLTFSWWGNDVRHFYTLQGLNLFQKDNPEIKVEHKYGVWDGFELKNRVYMKSGTNADVMQINYNWLREYSSDGSGYYDLESLRDLIDLSGYSSADLKAGRANGKLNAIPIAYNSTVFFFNQSIYDRYNLSIPETWEDLFEAASRMRKDGIYPLGLVKKHLFSCLMAYYEQTTGRMMFDENGFQMDQEDVQIVLEFYKRLVDEKVIPLTDEFGAEDFTAGKVAGVGCWNSDASRYCEALSKRGDNVVLGKNICKADGSRRFGWYIKPATMYAISANTEHPEEAAKLMDFLLNDSSMILLQGTEKGVPANRKARTVLNDAGLLKGFEYKANVNMMNNRERMGIMLPLMENAYVVDLFKSVGDEYIFGRQDLKTCSAYLIEKMQEAENASQKE